MTPQELVVYYQNLLTDSQEVMRMMEHDVYVPPHLTQIEGYGLLVEVLNEMRVNLYEYLKEGLRSPDPRVVTLASYAMDELQASIEDVTDEA